MSLCNTGLTQKIMEWIIPYIDQAPSLVGIHLSNNVGVTSEFRKKLIQHLKICSVEKNPELEAAKFNIVESKTKSKREQIMSDKK